MKNIVRYTSLLLFICQLMTVGVAAQRVSFGLYAADGIVLSKGSVDELNFNMKQHIILANSTVSIHLNDNEAAVLTIEGRSDLDISVSIDAPSSLLLNAQNSIPLALRFAYSNIGAATEAAAKTAAIQVPLGFFDATFPISRRTTAPPGPPPTPDHTGYTQPTGKAYLFIYGTLGAVPSNAAAGLYEGDITISVEYAKQN